MGYKDELQERADKIAGEKYDKDFYELSEKQQDKVYEEAQESWVDHYASLADSEFHNPDIKDGEIRETP